MQKQLGTLGEVSLRPPDAVQQTEAALLEHSTLFFGRQDRDLSHQFDLSIKTESSKIAFKAAAKASFLTKVMLMVCFSQVLPENCSKYFLV